MKDLFKVTVVFVAGALVGASAALLLTPKTGKEVRDQIKDLANDAKDRSQEYCEQVKNKVEEAVKAKMESKAKEA